MIKLVNLISGGGSTNLAVLKAEARGGKLENFAKTMAIVTSDAKAPGVEKAIDFGFSREHIHVVDPKVGLEDSLLRILTNYQPDFFHQLGWMPLTPEAVIKKFQGLNQHLGPGGKWMFGVRRIYAHLRFCELVGENRPIPIFCQKVAPNYDEGNTIYLKYEELSTREDINSIQERLTSIEHEVQIEALYRLNTGTYVEQQVPKITKNAKEEELLLKAKKEARDKYPSH